MPLDKDILETAFRGSDAFGTILSTRALLSRDASLGVTSRAEHLACQDP